MPKKAYKKKKAYQAAMRKQVKDGLINNVDGTWVRYNESGLLGNMHRDQRAGYKLLY